ncbi:MAG: SAM-dependent methyltransferase [Clostridia bacterium]|nr:SAM-dependent methyltransferase [Clostridia bacterium]
MTGPGRTDAGIRGRRCGGASLPPRLACIAGMVPPCGRLFDIGCDHALIPIHLALEGRCREAYAVDRRAGPLAVAADRIRKNGASPNVMPVLADGLDGMRPMAGDAVVIAGMGGLEIIRILDRCDGIPPGTSWILQPMKSAPELRRWLREAGFSIHEERLCRDGRRIYCVILARPGGNPADAALSEEEAWAGPCILRDRPPLLREHLTGVLTRMRKAARGRPDLESATERLAGILAETADR